MSPENAGARGVVFRPKQLRFLTVSDSPICYWLAPSLFSLAGAGTKRLGDYCEALEGLGTRDDARFIRYWWETSGLAGFVPLAKGGGYRKWYGDQDLKVAWGKHGERLKAYNSELYGGATGRVRFVIHTDMANTA